MNMKNQIRGIALLLFAILLTVILGYMEIYTRDAHALVVLAGGLVGIYGLFLVFFKEK